MSTHPIVHGCILSIDMLVENDYCQLVIPMIAGVAGGTPSNYDRLSYNCVQAFKAKLTDFLAQLSEKAYVIGIGAEAMINGRIPYRENYTGDTTHQGSRGGAVDVEPSSVGVVVDFYCATGDVATGTRTAVAHNTIPGIPEDDTGGNILTDALVGLWPDFWDDLVTTGWGDDDTAAGGDDLVWKRAMRAPEDRTNLALSVRLVIKAVVKRIVGSVRRRLAPPKR